MPVNVEELTKDLGTPEYQKIVRDTLNKMEYSVYSKDEHTAFQENFKKNIIETEMGPRVKAVHDQYDKDTKELFGLDRNADEKTFDYLKRAAGTQTAKIKDLEEQIKKGDPTGALKKQLEEAEGKYRAVLEEKDKEINTLKGNMTRTQIAAAIQGEYTTLKMTFKKTLPPLFEETEKAILSSVIDDAVLKDGKYYIGDGKGSPKLDKAFAPTLVSDFLKDKFSALIDGKGPAGGAGSGNGGKHDIDPKTINEDNFPMSADIKTRGQLLDHMVALGIPQRTPQFDKIWRKFATADMPH